MSRSHKGAAPKPRLRFDKVVLRLIRDLKQGLSADVPDGKTVIVTVTAPIRLPSKTAEALVGKIRALLERRPARAKLEGAIHGNEVRVRVLDSGTSGASKVVGFVHNPDSDAEILFDVAKALLACIGSESTSARGSKAARERCLVAAGAQGLAHPDTCRQVLEQLGLA